MALHMKKILDLLRDSSGLSAKEIAAQLDVDRKDINKLLYGNLQGQVWQDNSYKWHITDNSSIEIGEVKNVPLTDLARLCRYYLACLGQDDIGISTFAQSNYDDLDYGELNSLPQSTEKLLSEGIYVIGFFFPVVPKGEARIRVQISAGHSRAQLDHAIQAFINVGKQYNVV